MKRLIAGMAAALLAAVSFFPCKASALSAQKAIVMDAQTGRVLFEKNADERSLIASTTKIMTGLIICEQCNVLDRMRIPKEAVGIEGSSMYLNEGEILTIQDLLYGLMLQSGNDAAVALAIYCAGTVEGFVQLMNDKAHRLELRNTHFANPNGLDSPENYSTARDLAVLAAYAMENPLFYQTVSTQTVRCGQRGFRNHNKLLWSLEGADGVKTGYTKAAGRILVSSVTRQGRRLVAVTIDAPNDWQDHTTLIEDCFRNYQMQNILNRGQHVGEVQVAGGVGEKVALICTEDFSYPLATNEETQLVIPGTGFVYAPVAQGQDAGYAHVCIGDKSIGKVGLVYGQTIEQEPIKKSNLLQKLFGGKQS